MWRGFLKQKLLPVQNWEYTDMEHQAPEEVITTPTGWVYTKYYQMMYKGKTDDSFLGKTEKEKVVSWLIEIDPTESEYIYTLSQNVDQGQDEG